MLKAVLVIALALILVIGLPVAGCSSSNPPQGAASQDSKELMLAPDFELPSLDGQYVSLSDLQGKPVFINFWATSCPPCHYEMPYLEEVYQEWHDQGLVLLAINIGENPQEVWAFLQEFGYSFPVLLDRTGEVASKYNIWAWGIPVSFFIDKDGVIQNIRIGAFRSKAEIIAYLDKIITSD